MPYKTELETAQIAGLEADTELTRTRIELNKVELLGAQTRAIATLMRELRDYDPQPSGSQIIEAVVRGDLTLLVPNNTEPGSTVLSKGTTSEGVDYEIRQENA